MNRIKIIKRIAYCFGDDYCLALKISAALPKIVDEPKKTLSQLPVAGRIIVGEPTCKVKPITNERR